MHVINFFLAIFLPYISLFSKLAPPETIPIYFFSDEAAFVAGEFGAIVFYWAGFLRNYVARGTLTERRYFGYAAAVLIFMCASKIIFTLPYTWITGIFAFGLGVLSLSGGQTTGKKSMIFLIVLSLIILGYSTFILVGMAWFGFQPIAYYHYKEIIQIYLYDAWFSVRSAIAAL
jgi:hypothetical protein